MTVDKGDIGIASSATSTCGNVAMDIMNAKIKTINGDVTADTVKADNTIRANKLNVDKNAVTVGRQLPYSSGSSTVRTDTSSSTASSGSSFGYSNYINGYSNFANNSNFAS